MAVVERNTSISHHCNTTYFSERGRVLYSRQKGERGNSPTSPSLALGITGIDKLVPRYVKCLIIKGDYVE